MNPCIIKMTELDNKAYLAAWNSYLARKRNPYLEWADSWKSSVHRQLVNSIPKEVRKWFRTSFSSATSYSK